MWRLAEVLESIIIFLQFLELNLNQRQFCVLTCGSELSFQEAQLVLLFSEILFQVLILQIS